jgi:hypothetical protein
MIDLPPYIIKQPEDYFGYRIEQRRSYYKSIGHSNCINELDVDKRQNYTCLAQQYQPPPDPKHYRQRYGNC